MMEHERVSHYRLVRLLGRGGMGEVYEAVDLDLDRSVALKFVAPELAADPESAQRLEREARSAAALGHPHIATLYAFEREGSRRFLAMELMSGETLRDRIARGPLPLDQALAVARDVAAALAHAHHRGIVHRDIKPENLMFDEHGVVKITDFGLARAMQASRLTRTGTTLGTAAYMGPETARGGTGPGTDVFALGVVLYESLTGALPWEGDNPLAMMYAIANLPPRPLRAARPEAPEEVEHLVAGMLDRDPERRPGAAEVARTLAAIGGAAPPALPTPAPTAAGGAATPARTEELEAERLPRESGERALTPVRPPARGRGRRRALLWLVPLLLAAGGGGAVFAWSARAERQRAEALALNNRGFEALEHDSLDAARALLEAALLRNPRYGEAKLNLGLVRQRQGDETGAALLYGAVIREYPRATALVAHAHYNLAEMDMRAGAWSGAAIHLERSVALDSSSAAINNLGYALIMLGRPGDARQVLERGLVRFPGVAPLHKNAAWAALLLGDEAAALRSLDRAVTLDPKLAAAWGLRAEARARSGDRPGARVDWARYLALSPDAAERARIEAELRQMGVLAPRPAVPRTPRSTQSATKEAPKP